MRKISIEQLSTTEAVGWKWAAALSPAASMRRRRNVWGKRHSPVIWLANFGSSYRILCVSL